MHLRRVGTARHDGRSALIVARPRERHVQFHDILSILFRDILYTPARAKRARERTKGCHSELWMSGNKEFSLWWQRYGKKSHLGHCVKNLVFRDPRVGCG